VPRSPRLPLPWFVIHHARARRAATDGQSIVGWNDRSVWLDASGITHNAVLTRGAGCLSGRLLAVRQCMLCLVELQHACDPPGNCTTSPTSPQPDVGLVM